MGYKPFLGPLPGRKSKAFPFNTYLSDVPPGAVCGLPGALLARYIAANKKGRTTIAARPGFMPMVTLWFPVDKGHNHCRASFTLQAKAKAVGAI